MASRLIDKLLVDGYLDDVIKQDLLNCHAVEVDNILEYVNEYLSKKFDLYSDELESLGRIVPPFQKLFLQWQQYNREMGVLLYRETSKSGLYEWHVTGKVYLANFYCGGVILRMNTDGFLYDYPLIKLSPRIPLNEFEEYERDILRQNLHYVARIVLWTLAFMNTKNVIMEAVEPNASENKKRVKHGKLPLMRYHVLKIKPVGREAGHDQGGTHASPALHIRRGHFKTYTDAAPLFGKLVGTFWVDQHIAGKKSDRVVVKDYEVIAGG